MSPITATLGLMTMATAAMAAVPHYAHRHHHHSGRPTGVTGTGAPYGYGNSTGIYGATGTGTGFATGSATGITSSETATDTTTVAITSTVTASSAAAPNNNVAAVSDSASCSSSTVYQTYTNVVTVTVTSGDEASSESSSVASATAVTYKAENHHHSFHGYSSSSTSEYVSSSSVVAPVASSSSSEVAPVATSSTLSAYSASSSSVYVAPSSTSVYVAPTTSSTAAPVESSTSSTLSAYVPSTTSAAAASSTSSAASSSTSGSSSTKRGCAYAWDGEAACTAFSTSDVGWAYDWEPTINGLSNGMSFVPMLKDSSASRCTEWAADASAAITAGSTHLLGFNEPDEASQANLSVDEAVSLWNEHLQPFAGKAKLGGPAVTSNSAAGTGLDYLSSFLAACTDCTFDFQPIHWYGWDATQTAAEQASAFQTHVASAYSIAKKPIWVTEFAPVGGVDVDFLQIVIPWMEDDANNVERYSYYYASTMVSGTTLNSIGSAYQSA